MTYAREKTAFHVADGPAGRYATAYRIPLRLRQTAS